jgi:ferredoxin
VDPLFDPAAIFVAGHLLHGEQNALRRKLLYILARYLEVPFLRFGYESLLGRHRPLMKNPVSRALLRKLVFFPVAKYGDTGHPMLTGDVLELIDAQDSRIAIGACRCRVAHGACDHPLETDMVIRTGHHAFTSAFPDDYREIDRTEAKGLIESFTAQGLWHMVFFHCQSQTGANEYVICNCCRDGCVPFLLNKHLGQGGFPLVYGEHVARADDSCEGCGECLDACPWEARTLRDGRVAVEETLCFGCGLCVTACPNKAIVMRRERPRPPFRTFQ